MRKSGLHEAVEGVGWQHIREVPLLRALHSPSSCKHHYLGQLSPCCVVEGAEGIVGVAGDNASAIEVEYRLVKVVGWLHVRERHRASCGGAGGHWCVANSYGPPWRPRARAGGCACPYRLG